MDCNNFVSSVSNLDIDTKIETKHMFAKNGEGDILKCQAQVRIKSGRHEVILVIFRAMFVKLFIPLEILSFYLIHYLIDIMES
jgi:hypothetical protein